MKKLILSLPIFFAFILVMTGCGSKTVEPTIEEKLSKIWSAKVVTEGSNKVYDKTATTQTTPGYANYKLDLTSKTAAKLTEKDGTSYTGTWSLSTDNKTLTLSGLSNGGPTGTNGTMAYTIIGDVTTAAFSIQTTAPYLKAGSTLVNYQLVNP